MSDSAASADRSPSIRGRAMIEGSRDGSTAPWGGSAEPSPDIMTHPHWASAMMSEFMQSLVDDNDDLDPGWRRQMPPPEVLGLAHTEEQQHQMRLFSFDALHPVQMSVHDYVGRLNKYLAISQEAQVLSMVLLERVCQKKAIRFVSRNAHRLLLAAYLVGSKFHDDNVEAMSFYAAVGGVTHRELQLLLLNFLELADWSAFVPSAEYEDAVTRLQQRHLAEVRRRSPLAAAAAAAPSDQRHSTESGAWRPPPKPPTAFSSASSLGYFDDFDDERSVASSPGVPCAAPPQWAGAHSPPAIGEQCRGVGATHEARERVLGDIGALGGESAMDHDSIDWGPRARGRGGGGSPSPPATGRRRTRDEADMQGAPPAPSRRRSWERDSLYDCAREELTASICVRESWDAPGMCMEVP
eukprot:TRINITY_DN9681_c0_g1_i1.p1 TRINITY_DN9681_c0_g1~~TRINITY_DN9681_c0_g1_i1.p1  ORF type:complete len:411 (+),score=83.28 TRINITY_DN9681_c0_g1_i1:146-1378(+)